jgi:FkbM family methyltransferase
VPQGKESPVNFNPIYQTGRVLRRAGNQLLGLTSLKGTWIDVGAHRGETTLGCANHNPRLTIYAFEPNLRAAAKIMGRAPNYVVIPMAVAEIDGTAQLHLNSHDAASSLLTMDEDARRSWKGGEALKEESIVGVPTIRLDTFMDRTGISCVDFLKIDAQGSDLAVIRSAGVRIRDIRKITLEVDVAPKRLYRGSSSKVEVLSFLQAAGFKLISNEQQSSGQEENLTFGLFSPQ